MSLMVDMHQTEMSSLNFNGHFGLGSSSIVTRGYPNTTNSEFPFLSNPLGLNFLDPTTFYANSQNGLALDRQIAENGPGQIATESSQVDYGLTPAAVDIPTDVGVDEEEELPGYSVNAEVGEAEEAVEAISAGEAIAEGSTPVGLALIVNQQLGEAVNQAATNYTQNVISSDYAQNMQQHGLNVGLDASLIRSNQEQTMNNQNVGGSIGSLFGPIGALIGHAVAGVVNADPNLFQTSGSFQGAINPSDNNIVASQSTAELSGTNSLQDNVTNNAN